MASTLSARSLTLFSLDDVTGEYFQLMLLDPTLVVLLVAVPLCVGSFILLRHAPRPAALLLLIGSVAFLLYQTLDFFLLFMMPFVLEHRDAPFIAAIWPGCTPHSAFYVAQRILTAASLCFPAGFTWWALHARRKSSNQAMQRTADRPYA